MASGSIRIRSVALCPAVYSISDRSDVIGNIERIDRLVRTALWTANLQLPARLVTVPEGALQGFADEIHDMEPCRLRQALCHRHPQAGDGPAGQDLHSS